MGDLALKIYDQLLEAKDDRDKARVIAEAIATVEERFLIPSDVATSGQLRETELRLQKEIKELEARVMKEMKELEVRTQKELREVESRLMQAIHRQTLWTVMAVGAVIGILRALEIFIR